MKFKFSGVFEDKRFITTSDEWKDALEKLQGRPVDVSIETSDTRTELQNKALHKFFAKIAAELNGVGIPAKTISIISGKTLEREWTLDLVKELIWRPVQTAILGTDSTRLLKTDEIDKISDPIIKFLGKQGIGIMFPSQESLHLNKVAKQ